MNYKFKKELVYKSRLCISVAVCFIFFSCNSTYTSKKRGYFRVEFPQKKYVIFKKEGFPYTFEYPVYANIVQDTTYFDSNPENPLWINIDFPVFNAKIFLSYKIIGGKALYKTKRPNGTYRDSISINEFDKLVNDAFKLTNKNQVIASSIKDSLIRTRNGITGIFFKVAGNAATAKQFFLSDTTTHFLRGALYFNTTPNADSLKPVQDFLQTDIDHLLQTFKWVNQ